MSCPYFQSDCPERTLPADAASCPSCLRFLKRCPACGVRSRAFANVCRSCGTELATAPGNWTSCRGSSQRLGLASSPGWEPRRGESLEVREKNLQIQLGDTCRSLLGYDRHLVAISQSGSIEICDPELAAPSLRLKADGPISCEPCIARGLLLLGSPGRLTAYSLGALTLASPRLAPLWQLPLSGTPIQALTAVGNRLYVTVFHQANGRKEVQAIESLERNPPQPGRLLCSSQRLSWAAADPESQELVFLSQQEDGTRLHTATASASGVELDSRPLSGIPGPFAEHVPIAFLGGKVFGVFGDAEELCRLDARTGELEQSLGADTKLFSISQDRGRAWDGDGVQIGTNGVVFLRTDTKEPLPPLDRVKGSPVVVQGRAAVLGMQDGRLRMYDLRHLPRNDVRRLAGDGEPISALASFHNYVAAGNAKGLVKVFELLEDGAAA